MFTYAIWPYGQPEKKVRYECNFHPECEGVPAVIDFWAEDTGLPARRATYCVQLVDTDDNSAGRMYGGEVHYVKLSPKKHTVIEYNPEKAFLVKCRFCKRTSLKTDEERYCRCGSDNMEPVKE